MGPALKPGDLRKWEWLDLGQDLGTQGIEEKMKKGKNKKNKNKKKGNERSLA